MSYRNCFENNNRPVTINSMFNECSAVHLHSNALQVIRVPHEFLTRITCSCVYVCMHVCVRVRMCICVCAYKCVFV